MRRFDPSVLARVVMNEGTSERLRSMTYPEFFADIDATIRELGLDLNELQRLQQERQGNPDAFYTFVLPLYVRLREKGYAHYPDLTA